MASKTVNALNTISGRVAQVPASYLDSPDFGPYLVEVPEGTKDYDPKFFKAGTAEEHKAKPSQQRKAEEKAEVKPTSGE